MNKKTWLASNQKLRKPVNIIVFGAPGSGKTTLTRHLANQLNGVAMFADPLYHAQAHCFEEWVEQLTWAPVGDILPVVYYIKYISSEEILSKYTAKAWPEVKKILFELGDKILDPKLRHEYTSVPTDKMPYDVVDPETGEKRKTLYIPKYIQMESNSNPYIRIHDFYAPTEKCLKEYDYSIHVKVNPDKSFEKFCERVKNRLEEFGISSTDMPLFRKNHVVVTHKYSTNQNVKIDGFQDFTFDNKYDGDYRIQLFVEYVGQIIMRDLKDRDLIES